MGLAGERSGLFKYVLKILAMAKDCHFASLEKVSNMIGKDMKVVLLEIIRWLVVLGFVHISFVVVSASAVGKPHERRRWFCLAHKSNADLDRLRKLLQPMTADELSALATEPWNPDSDRIPMEEWLMPGVIESDRQRLLQLGNAVVPRCAEVAARYLAHL